MLMTERLSREPSDARRRVQRRWHKTRRGRVFRVVAEHYLRDDIPCGSAACHVCAPLASPAAALLSGDPFGGRYLLVDDSAVLGDMDLLEADVPPLCDVIVPSTVWSCVSGSNIAVGTRLQRLLRAPQRRWVLYENEHDARCCETADETIADVSGDAAVLERRKRVVAAAAYLSRHFEPLHISLLLVSNDVDTVRAAQCCGVSAATLIEVVALLSDAFPELVDLTSGLATTGDSTSQSGTEGGARYAEHVSSGALKEGLESGRYLRGTLRVSRDVWFEGRVGVSLPSSGHASVHVRGSDAMSRAMDGDVVALELLPESEWRAPSKRLEPTAAEAAASPGEATGQEGEEKAPDVSHSACGCVVSIIRRNWRYYAGSLELDEGLGLRSSHALFVPVDRRIPKVRIVTRQKAGLMDKRIVVAIDGWPATSGWPIGHYVRTLGTIGDRGVETDVVLLEHSIPVRAFAPDVMACLPPADWMVMPDNSIGRRDLRRLHVLSIDPPGCRDIDDALHALELPNGNLQVGVHIADVTHFVRHETAIDREARERANTTYLVDRRLDMLPGLLTETLCSLKPRVDRFAFSVLWELTPSIDVVRVDFVKSIVHSRDALTYAEAQAMLDDVAAASGTAKSVKLLARVARVLRERRVDSGALALASPEVRFMLDSETHDPLQVEAYVQRETNSLVEEFMLFANIAVARRVTDAFPSASLLRRHPPPDARAFDALKTAAATAGVVLDTSSSKALAESLDRAVVRSNPGLNQLLRILTTRCMTQATYFCSSEFRTDATQFRHYGLATPIYTHFTSPIRRYADVVVHRLLAAAMDLEPLPREYEDSEWMRATCDNLNQRHLNSQLAGRASVDLHTLVFFSGKVVAESALVMRVRSNGVVVLIPKYGLEGNAYVVHRRGCQGAAREDNMFEYDGKGQSLTHRDDPRLTLHVFDRIRVAVFVEELMHHRRELVIRIVDPPVHDLPVLGAGGVHKRDRDGADGGPVAKRVRRTELTS